MIVECCRGVEEGVGRGELNCGIGGGVMVEGSRPEIIVELHRLYKKMWVSLHRLS